MGNKLLPTQGVFLSELHTRNSAQADKSPGTLLVDKNLEAREVDAERCPGRLQGLSDPGDERVYPVVPEGHNSCEAVIRVRGGLDEMPTIKMV